MSVGSAARPVVGRARLQARAGTPAITAICVLTLLGAALRFWRIGHQGFWFDEGNTALLVHLPPGKMLGLLPQSESTPPLYYCLLWVWARVFGFGEAGLRSLSALAGTFAVPVAYGIAAEMFSGSDRPAVDSRLFTGSPRRAGFGGVHDSAGTRAGLIAAALTACNPLLIWYSQEARAYSLVVLLTGLSVLFWVRARAEPSAGRLALWAVAAGLSLATEYYALVVVVPQALWLLWQHRTDRRAWVAFLVVGLCGLALLPLALSQNSTGNDSWIASAAFGPRLRQIIPQFLIGTDMPDRTAFKYAAFGLALIALALLGLRARAAELRAALVASALALGGFVLALILVVAGFDDLITRNILALWLPAAVAVTGGLSVERARALGTVVATALCSIGIVATIGIGLDRNLQRPDWRYVARALGPWPAAQGARPGASSTAGRAILIQHYAYLLPLSLYIPHLQVLTAPARVTEIDVISMSSPQQPLCWWGAACNLIPSQMQARYPIAGFRAISRRQVLQFTILTLRASRAQTITRADVAAVLRTTRLHHDVLIYQRG